MWKNPLQTLGKRCINLFCACISQACTSPCMGSSVMRTFYEKEVFPQPDQAQLSYGLQKRGRETFSA